MQTTLLGLAIAIILALVSALVAPLVVDWNHYRSTFEAEASRLTGMDVRIDGPIEARILPSPLIKLRDVEVGQAGSEPQMRASTLELEVGLGPLLRGEIRASEMHLIAPQINVGLDRSGAIDWPALSPSFKPETLSISRLNVENGRVVLTDAASGSRLVLQKLWFNGDIRSLAGPFNGTGAFVAGDELYGYRISGNGTEDGGGLKLRFGVDSTNHPLTTDIDGTLTLDHGVPQFAGTLALARPVGATLANGKRVMNEPWHAGGRIAVTPASASLQDFALQYGPDERAIIFNGKADLTLGTHPHLDGSVTALQVDVDRALANPDVTQRRPLIVFENFLETLTTGVKLPMPARIGVGIDAMTIAGTTLQSLHGDVHYDERGWSLDRFSFRAPGFTQVSLSGRLDETPQGIAFTGPATVEAADVNMLLAWLEGRGDLPSGQANSMRARGDLTIARDRLAVDRFTASLDQENVEGSLAYTWATDDRPAILNADLRAPNLNLDALKTFAKTAVSDNGFELPHQVALALDIGKATFAGIDARAVKAQLKLDAGALQIDRLSVGDLGGSALGITGRIDKLSSQPRGRLTLDLDARALGGLTDVVGKFAPQSADILHRFADRLAPAKVHAILNVDQAQAPTAGSTAKLNLNGQFGLMRVALDGDATGDPSHLGDAAVRLGGRIDADDGGALTALFGLDRFLAVDQLPSRVTLSAVGPLNGDLRVDGQASASGLDAALKGVVRLGGENGTSATLQVLASAADLRPLHQIMTGQPGGAVPVSARAALAVAGTDLSFTDVAVTAGKTSARGRFDVDLSRPTAINGDIEANDLDGLGVAAMLLGLPAKAQSAGGQWSNQSMGAGAFTLTDGAVTFKIDRAAVTPTLLARNLKGVVHLRPSEMTFDGIGGDLAGGHLTGDLAFHHDVDGLAARGSIKLDGVDAATVFAPESKAVDGKLTMTLQCDGMGQSPASLVGSLHGSGAITLLDGHFATIDPAAFTAAISAADQSGTIEVSKIRSVVGTAMANGRLAVPYGDAVLTVASGQINLANATLQAQDGATLSLNGTLNLSNATLDARMTLSGQSPPNALISTRPELAVAITGPLAVPTRKLDVSALTAWLTLRAAELQTRRIESIEANRRDAATGPFFRPASPIVRPAPRGTVVESAIPANAPPPPGLGARSIERLQPELPAATPGETGADSGRIDRGGAPVVTLPLRPVTPKLLAPRLLAPRLPRRPDGANSVNVTPGVLEQNRRRVAPQTSAPQATAPRPPLDLLFRP